MTAPRRIAIIGNALPRRCGIATFTTDLQQAIAASGPGIESCIVAMTDPGQVYDYPPEVAFQIQVEHAEQYIRAAGFLNAGAFDTVNLQHEFGIFGGEAGSYILELLSRLRMPIVTTLHTVLVEPTNQQRAVMQGIVELSSKIVVMAEMASDLLREIYQVPAEKIEIIAHGIPDFPFVAPDAAKARLGFVNRSVILTFGLLSPNKGVEVMIDAMPTILKSCAKAVYVVLGATHPNLVRDQGEAYRESLLARVRELGVGEHVVFLDQFVEQFMLLEFISACDVYATPYLNEAQMTSGTLAYSFGLGKAVVSTPYWHARELLTDGHGVLVPFGDATAIGREIAELLTDDDRRAAMGTNAYAASRKMTWARTAARYISLLETARPVPPLTVVSRSHKARPETGSHVASPMQLGHFLSMCDDTGLFQHAVYAVPDRSHGYCVDDNARALLLACVLNNNGEQRLSEILTARFASFVQHAWNPDTRRFRNFMGFNRTWLEPSGSEDSHGRTLWALGECAGKDANPSRRQWAARLFVEALTTVQTFSSPRAWAFTLLGLDGYCASVPADLQAQVIRRVLAEKLIDLLAAVETPDWVWFEESLSYDNARLPQALMATGMATKAPAYTDAGLRSLRWLMTQQTASSGNFRPIGSANFGQCRQNTRHFDQQPLEATATIAACVTACLADSTFDWKAVADQVFAWFHGSNDLSLALVDMQTGSCRDGLHPDRANENLGGESVLSYLLGLADIRQLARNEAARTKAAEPYAVVS